MKYLFALLAGLLLVSTTQANGFHRGRVAFVGFRTYTPAVSIVNYSGVNYGATYGAAYGGSCGSVNTFNGVGTDCGYQGVQTTYQRQFNLGVGIGYSGGFSGVGYSGVGYSRGFNSVGYQQRTVGFDRFGRPIVRSVRVGFGY